MITKALLPPPLVHELRSRSFPRLFRMTGSPGNRGFGRYLRQRIRMLVERENTAVEQAITTAYLGSFLVDHLVHAEKNACRILEQRVFDPGEEQSLWNQHYGQVVLTLVEELPDGQSILEAMDHLPAYSRLPEVVYRIRDRHWDAINEILRREVSPGTPAVTEVALLRKVQFVLAGDRSVRSKAVVICLAASLLADRQCWFRHLPWPVAYMHIMTDLYPFVSQDPAVLEEIIYLDQRS
jgi:hypothetical protein